MEEKWYNMADDFEKPRTSTNLIIRKFNRDNQLCYYDKIDLTCKNLSAENLNIFVKLFENAGFSTDIKTYTYFGIYDPSRAAELIEIFPTDEKLLQNELRFKTYEAKVQSKKWYQL